MIKNLRKRLKKRAYFMVSYILPGIFICTGSLAQNLIDTNVVTRQDTLLKEKDLIPNQLNDKLPVLYQIQSKDRIIQSVSYLNGAELEKIPTPFLSSSISGQLAGLYTSQKLGTPSADGADLNLRGRMPLILIDGIPRNILSINPEQVKSVTVLKDALSTAMLGMRGMDGAILITTRKGAESKKQQLSFTSQTGIQSPLGLRKTLSSYDYAILFNEAQANTRLQQKLNPTPPTYTQIQLDSYINNADPFKYPNTNWYNTVLKDNAAYSRYTFNAAGNSNAINYFFSVDYLNQDGLFRENSANTYSTNINNKRYIFRTNVEIKLDEKLTAFLNILGNLQDVNQPGNTANTIFNDILTTPNNAYPALNFNATYGGSGTYQDNILAQSQGSGYLKNSTRSGLVDISLQRNMDGLLKGLRAKTLLSYNPLYEQQLTRNKNFEVFKYNSTSDTTSYSKFGTKTIQANNSAVVDRSQQTYGELSLAYDHINNKHAFNSLLLANYDSYQNKNLLSEIYQGISGRFAYNYDNRYGFEIAAAYNGNNRFIQGRQFGFFPAAGVSWQVENEKQFSDHIHFINQFKLRATYGLVGNANPGYYVFQQKYIGAPPYILGTSATTKVGFAEGDLPNANRTWEKARKLNIGTDIAFAKQRGWISFDYYSNRQYDLLQQRGHNTTILGQIYPDENIGINKYSGIELTSGWADKRAGINYYISGNFSTRLSRIIDIDEVSQPYSYLQQTGGTVNQIRGYIADGFFTNPAIGPSTLGYTPIAGDIKYKDLNNDGIIDQFDMTSIGNTKPLLFYGVSLGFQYKSFDLGLILQGVSNRDILLTGDYEWEFQNGGNGQAFEQHLNRWTSETPSTATYPRLTVGTNSNNHTISSFWIRSGDFIRLKNAEFGYNYTNKFLTKIMVQSIRFFVNGLNLYTLSDYKESDPESYTGGYPLERVINGGINIKF